MHAFLKFEATRKPPLECVFCNCYGQGQQRLRVPFGNAKILQLSCTPWKSCCNQQFLKWLYWLSLYWFAFWSKQSRTRTLFVAYRVLPSPGTVDDTVGLGFNIRYSTDLERNHSRILLHRVQYSTIMRTCT